MIRPIVLLLLNTAFALAVPAANADLTLSVSAESADLANAWLDPRLRLGAAR